MLKTKPIFIMIIGIFLSLSVIENATSTPKSKDKKHACTTVSGGEISCQALQDCLLDGGSAESDSAGDPMCCPEELKTNPNQTCTMADKKSLQQFKKPALNQSPNQKIVPTDPITTPVKPKLESTSSQELVQ
ncbi:MAG: hypothetical protein V7776_12430 [Halopseudomonas aestusnigri]